MSWYIAVIRREEDRFIVSFPDAPSIRVARDRLEDALDLGGQALDAEIRGWRAKGITPAHPTQLSAMAPASEDVNYALVEIAAAPLPVSYTPVASAASAPTDNVVRVRAG